MKKFSTSLPLLRPVILTIIYFISAYSYQAPPDPKDPYGWLEEIGTERVINWVMKANNKSLKFFAAQSGFDGFLERARLRLRQTMTDPAARLPLVQVMGDYVSEVHKGSDSKGGLLQYTTWKKFISRESTWTTLLDLDRLSAKETKTWLLGSNYNLSEGNSVLVTLPPKNHRCLVFLSQGGTDASIAREMDLRHPGEFVKDGFEIPEARSSAVWIDSDTLLIGTDFGQGTLSSFKTPLSVRVWKRGKPLSEAKLVLSADKGQLAVLARALSHRNERHFLIERHIDFFRREAWYWRPGTDAVHLPIDPEHIVVGLFNGQLLIWLRKEFNTSGHPIPGGSLVSASLQEILSSGNLGDVIPVFVPHPSQAIQTAKILDDAVYIFIVEHVSGKLVRATRKGEIWTMNTVPLPDLGTMTLITGNSEQNELVVAFENLITPATLYHINGQGSVRELRSLPAITDSSRLTVEQRFAISKDGTRVPYFIARPKEFVFDGSRPALLTGYGGFAVVRVPRYLGGSFSEIAAAELLESGGTFIHANMRGGGEYGPRWHTSAILENKQRTWDDFTAVAEDITKSGITSANRLGIAGASHGGLLVGVAFTQRPDLFRAVWCEIPGLDMLRYHVLFSSGAMAEYGNPDDPKMRPHIKAYSPYQNVQINTRYPSILFYTNSRDDRVHPAHARKMYAKMLEMGNDVYFFEDAEGGHGFGAGIEGMAQRQAMMTAFFQTELFEKND